MKPIEETHLMKNEREAIIVLSARLAERVYNRLTDSF